MRRTGRLVENHQDSSRSALRLWAQRYERGPLVVRLSITAAFAAIISPATVNAQAVSEETLRRIYTTISVAPDAACKIPQTDIERWLTEHVNDYGLMDDVSRNVFQREPSAPPQSGYAALLGQVREQSRQQEARDRATYEALETGQQVPVGQGAGAAPPDYYARLRDVRAIERVEDGLNCEANVEVEFLRFAITYTMTLDANQSDGWASTPQIPLLNEAQALAEPSNIRVVYDGSELTLAQARHRSEIALANRNAAIEQARQQELAEEAYRNSPAGRAAAAAQLQALSEEYKRRGLACQNSGGTWGVRWDNNTILEVPPGEVPGEIARFSLGCYHL